MSRLIPLDQWQPLLTAELRSQLAAFADLTLNFDAAALPRVRTSPRVIDSLVNGTDDLLLLLEELVDVAGQTIALFSRQSQAESSVANRYLDRLAFGVDIGAVLLVWRVEDARRPVFITQALVLQRVPGNDERLRLVIGYRSYPSLTVSVVTSDSGRLRGVLRLRAPRLLIDALHAYATNIYFDTDEYGDDRLAQTLVTRNSRLLQERQFVSDGAQRLAPLLRAAFFGSSQLGTYVQEVFGVASAIANGLDSGQLEPTRGALEQALRQYTNLISVVRPTNLPTDVPRRITRTDTLRIVALALVAYQNRSDDVARIVLPLTFADDLTDYDSLVYREDQPPDDDNDDDDDPPFPLVPAVGLPDLDDVGQFARTASVWRTVVDVNGVKTHHL